jgi:hypothetical protein
VLSMIVMTHKYQILPLLFSKEECFTRQKLMNVCLKYLPDNTTLLIHQYNLNLTVGLRNDELSEVK